MAKRRKGKKRKFRLLFIFYLILSWNDVLDANKNNDNHGDDKKKKKKKNGEK